MTDVKLKDADKLMKKAEKCLQPALLSGRFRPAWDEAYPLFEKAALQYKVLGDSNKAALAYEKAAEANARGGGTAWHAGKNLEAAAQICCEARQWNRAVSYARQAAEQYVDCGKLATGAEGLGRCARWLSAEQPKLAAHLYDEAVALYAKDGMASCAADVVQRGVALTVSQSMWDEAVALLLKWATICSQGGSPDLLSRAYLGVIVIQLHAGRAQAAWAAYQDFLDVEDFSSSSEARLAEALFLDYAEGSADSVRQRVSKHRCISALDGSVARLGRALPAKSVDFESMAGTLRALMGIEAPHQLPDGAQGDREPDLT